MSYCTVDDIRSDFKNLSITATTPVTETEVQEFILQESNFINGRICHQYVVPVSEVESPIAFSLLKRINIFLAADRVRHVLEIKTGTKMKDQETKGMRSFSRDPRKDLDDILNGKLKLADAIKIEECLGFDTSDEPNGCGSNTFDVNKQQW